MVATRQPGITGRSAGRRPRWSVRLISIRISASRAFSAARPARRPNSTRNVEVAVVEPARIGRADERQGADELRAGQHRDDEPMPSRRAPVVERMAGSHPSPASTQHRVAARSRASGGAVDELADAAGELRIGDARSGTVDQRAGGSRRRTGDAHRAPVGELRSGEPPPRAGPSRDSRCDDCSSSPTRASSRWASSARFAAVTSSIVVTA